MSSENCENDVYVILSYTFPHQCSDCGHELKP
jgi:hypothetical protein